MKTKSNKGLVIALILACLLIALVPLFALKGAEFGGSDDAGGEMVSEVTQQDYEPWFTPVLETLLGGELPGEVESLMFCLQTGIGVGIIAFVMGRLVERKKWQDKLKSENPTAKPSEIYEREKQEKEFPLQPTYIYSSDFCEHDFGTTGSKRAQQEREYT